MFTIKFGIDINFLFTDSEILLIINYIPVYFIESGCTTELGGDGWSSHIRSTKFILTGTRLIPAACKSFDNVDQVKYDTKCGSAPT